MTDIGNSISYPEPFRLLLRHLPPTIQVQTHPHYAQYKHFPNIRATKTGKPYLVLVNTNTNTRVSISRVRRESEEWHYLVRWPFPAPNAQQEKLRTADPLEVIAKVESI